MVGLKRTLLLRWFFFIMGLMIVALGIALTIKAKPLGIGPWDVFHYGLYLQFGLTIGSWSIIVGFLIILFTSIVTSSFPKIGTLLNMLFLGLFIDLYNFILYTPTTLVGQVLTFILGTIILGYGIGMYIAADLGAGPRDGLMLFIVEKTGWKISWVRNGNEILVFILGWLLGGPVGIGTVIIAFTLGNIVAISLPQAKVLLAHLSQQDRVQPLK